jgi:hypothetical protein
LRQSRLRQAYTAQQRDRGDRQTGSLQAGGMQTSANKIPETNNFCGKYQSYLQHSEEKTQQQATAAHDPGLVAGCQREVRRL